MPGIHVRFEPQLVEPLLDSFVQRNGVLSERCELPSPDDLEVEPFPGEVVVVVLVPVGVLLPIDSPILASALSLVADLRREGLLFIADMDGGTRYCSFHMNLV